MAWLRRTKRRIAAEVVVLLVAGSAAALLYLWQRPKPQPNVLVILIDTLRADHLSMNGYPRQTTPVLDAFAKENLNFRNAMTPAPWTPAAVASLFTGLYPSSHGMVPPNSRREARNKSKMLSDRWQTLPELFKQNGYITAGVSPNPWIKPEFGYNRGFDSFVYSARSNASGINRAAKNFLDRWRRQKPFFLYLHYLDPHDPYTPPPPFNTMYTGEVPGRSYSAEQTDMLRRYDGEIRYTDAEIGKLFGLLKQRGLYDDLVIVVLADHGEQFMERGHQGHGYNVYNEEAHVPLMIKAGGRRAEIDTVVSSIDIYPTLVDVAGLKGSASVEGFSLTSALDQRRKIGVMTEIKRVQNQKAYTTPEGLKLVMDFSMDQDLRLALPPQAQRLALFNFHQDPLEHIQVSDPALVEQLRAAFSQLYSTATALQSPKDEQIELDQSTVKELQTLGYM